MAIECYDSDCKFHCVNNGGDGPFCDEDECKNPPLVDCPYCGAKIPEGTATPPVDYCSH